MPQGLHDELFFVSHPAFLKKSIYVHALDLMCVKTKHGEVMEREEVHDLVGDEEDFMAVMPDGTRLVRPVARGWRNIQSNDFPFEQETSSYC
ncbi:hypothetical protein BSKO_13508 [Bryopsis sp. KO-2023]|nr:hypothetical protein BSKO_13508 [Bryopsis sp. KO-2023]